MQIIFDLDTKDMLKVMDAIALKDHFVDSSIIKQRTPSELLALICEEWTLLKRDK